MQRDCNQASLPLWIGPSRAVSNAAVYRGLLRKLAEAPRVTPRPFLEAKTVSFTMPFCVTVSGRPSSCLSSRRGGPSSAPAGPNRGAVANQQRAISTPLPGMSGWEDGPRVLRAYYHTILRAPYYNYSTTGPKILL